MIILEHEQGSPEWHQARALAVTASTFGDAVSKVGGLTEQQAKYVEAIKAGKADAEALAIAGYKAKPTADGIKRALAGLPVGEPSDASEKAAITKAVEWISRKPYGYNPEQGERKFAATERGHEEESFGRMIYEGRNKVIVEECGLILTDDGLFGYSPDGLVNSDGLIECKTPVNLLKYFNVVHRGDISEYFHQVQGGMWITGRKWCDLIVPAPDLACLGNGNELYVRRVYRDDNFIDQMVDDLWAFVSRVKHYEKVLRTPYTQAANDAMAKLADAA